MQHRCTVGAELRSGGAMVERNFLFGAEPEPEEPSVPLHELIVHEDDQDDEDDEEESDDNPALPIFADEQQEDDEDDFE
jgi:hypothetical protein